MRRMLLSVCAALAVLGCGGDDNDSGMPPCMSPDCARVYSRCGDRAYDSSTEFCSGGTVYTKSSSSSVALSSSSVPTFACTMTAAAGTVGVAITPVPAVTCNGSTVTAGLVWTPANLTPTTAGSISVSVSANSGVCSGMAAQCGSVTVSPPTLACTMTATTGIVGVAITPAPAATCNGSTVTAGLVWTPENLTPATAGSISVSVSASSGVCGSMAAQCGSVTVSPPTLACTMTATTGTVGVAITPTPTATCNGSTVTAGLAWTPANLTPTATGSVSVSVSASSGVCSGRVAQCGSVTVSTPIVACTIPAVSDGSVTCDGQTYKTVVIGTQTWFAENLNYVVEGSKCYNNSSANCDKYGRLYNWATAMNLPASCNSITCSGYIQSKHQGICPAGWHLPSDAEWDVLVTAVGSLAGTKLKATSGWNINIGTDEYGFSALPGGSGWSDGSFIDVGDYGYWWCATEDGASVNYGNRVMGRSNGDVSGGIYGSVHRLLSIRCIQD